MNLRRGMLLVSAALSCACAIAAGACGGDDSLGSGATDGGPDVTPPNPPPPPPPQPDATPPDGIDRTGMLGTATVIADVGEETDGPSWHAPEGALYFTMPGNAQPLRRLVPGKAVEVVPYEGGVPIGTASAGGAQIAITERGGVALLDVDDAGVATITRREAVGNGIVPGDVAATFGDAGALSAYFVDSTSTTTFAWDTSKGPPGDVLQVAIFDLADAGGRHATGIALEPSSSGIFVTIDTTPTPRLDFRVRLEGAPFDSTGTRSLSGGPPNAVALDSGHHIFVAWARGIDVYDGYASDPSSEDRLKLVGPSPGLPLAAAPTSLAFGGTYKNVLFVTTASGKIYSVPAGVEGILR